MGTYGGGDIRWVEWLREKEKKKVMGSNLPVNKTNILINEEIT